jgi:hypothetical protein
MGVIRKQQPNSVLQPLMVGLGWLTTLYMILEYSGLTRNQRVTECPDKFCNNPNALLNIANFGINRL